MMPGKINPRQMNQMMRRLGINVKEIKNVVKVVIQTDSQEYVFDEAEVTMMDAQGQRTFQIMGKPRIVEREAGVPAEDIRLVMQQTGKSEDEATQALKATKGDIAEAILKLTEQS
jgi:nascent polypeptide-associated complex subunit alpha